MLTTADIFDQLIRLAQTKQEVRLVNEYKGIPISYEAVLQSVGENSATLAVHKYQAVCLELERRTFIISEGLTSVLRAQVASVDVVSSTSTLNEFSYAPETIGGRSAVRVEPKEPVTVTLLSQGRKFSGSLADISVSGLGVYTVAAYIYTPGFLKKGAPVQIAFKLPSERGEIRLPGMVLNITKDKGSYRLGIGTTPDALSKNAISQFVAQRQSEILREVKMFYDLVYRLKTGENQRP